MATELLAFARFSAVAISPDGILLRVKVVSVFPAGFSWPFLGPSPVKIVSIQLQMEQKNILVKLFAFGLSGSQITLLLRSLT